MEGADVEFITNFVYFCIFVMIPLAFFHGWYSGRKDGIQVGADGMFEVMWLKGVPKPGDPSKRVVEIEK